MMFVHAHPPCRKLLLRSRLYYHLPPELPNNGSPQRNRSSALKLYGPSFKCSSQIVKGSKPLHRGKILQQHPSPGQDSGKTTRDYPNSTTRGQSRMQYNNETTTKTNKQNGLGFVFCFWLTKLLNTTAKKAEHAESAALPKCLQ